MRYDASTPFHGQLDRAFALAESALTALGFRITQRTSGSIELVGPGMISTRQSPLVGASRIQIRDRSGELSVEAELGGVARMSRFVTVFPIALVVGLGVVLAGAFSMALGPGLWIAIVAVVVGGNAALWFVLGPMIARHIRARTDRALDALLANMTAVGGST